MKKILIRSTSVHRPMFLTVDDTEYEVDGIDKQEGDFTLADRWIIDDILKEFNTDISAYQGGHGEFYVGTYMVSDDFDLFVEINKGKETCNNG